MFGVTRWLLVRVDEEHEDLAARGSGGVFALADGFGLEGEAAEGGDGVV